MLGLLERDFSILRTNLWEFAIQSLVQPVFFVLVFLYILPKIGSIAVPTGAAAAAFAATIFPGLMALSAFFRPLYSVSTRLSVELGLSREIEDRLSAPLSDWQLIGAKVVFGGAEAIIAAFLVLPFVYLIPPEPPTLSLNSAPIVFAAILVLGLLAGSLAVFVGTIVQPGKLGIVFTVIVVPFAFLGCTYYSWVSMGNLPWLKWIVLLNPIVFMSECLRSALTADLPHMNTAAALGGGVAYSVAFFLIGRWNFRRRVIL